MTTTNRLTKEFPIFTGSQEVLKKTIFNPYFQNSFLFFMSYFDQLESIFWCQKIGNSILRLTIFFQKFWITGSASKNINK